MDSPSAPSVPDPYATANAQGAANKDAARTTTSLNRADQYTPYGNLTWSQGAPAKTFNQERYDAAVKGAQAGTAASGGHWQTTGDYSDAGGGGSTWVPGSGGTPGTTPDRNDSQFYDETPSDRWSSQITLDPRVQSLVDSQLATSQGLNGATQSALTNVNDAFSKPIDYNALPAAGGANEDTRKSVEDALMGRYSSRLDPQFAQQENKMRSDLMNRGIVEGSEAWKTQLDNFGRGKNDAYATAREDAVAKGGLEAQRQFEMQNTSRQNALSEQERKRSLVLNELNALRTGSQAQMPNFTNTNSGTSVNPAPVAQSVYNGYQGQMGQYNADVASSNSNTTGMMSLAATAIMMY